MTVEVLRKLLLRELTSVREQVQLYEHEADLWKQTEAVRNAGGNLVLHICGNLQHFIGATLDHTGYVRDRDREFSRKDASREDLLTEIDHTRAVVDTALGRLPESTLDMPFPLEVGGTRLDTRLFLAHLCTHLSYHLGQLDSHRRFVTGRSGNLAVLSLRALAD